MADASHRAATFVPVFLFVAVLFVAGGAIASSFGPELAARQEELEYVKEMKVYESYIVTILAALLTPKVPYTAVPARSSVAECHIP